MAHSYYISPGGKDSNSGTSPATAWQTITRLSKHNFSPGDSILFQGGHTFQGSLYFDSNDNSTASAPILISSYGAGRATIDADTSYGLYAYNKVGITIQNLNFVGSGYQTNNNHGILFYNDLPGNTKLQGVIIDQVEVRGFRKAGISFGSWNGNSGFSDVRIMYAVVHDVGSEGITTWGFFAQDKVGYSHRNIYVGHCHVYDVHGLPLKDKHSGSGIILSDVDGGTIEYSVAHHCGTNNLHCGGPVGIWAWDANNILIQYNEAYNISSGSGCDGGGFDLDGGVTNSVMQYNYSHDNDGAGFLIAQFEWARPMHNNTIRYNISENDGRKNGYKGITLWVADAHNSGGNHNLLVHNNTVYADKSIAPSGGGVYFKSGHHHKVRFYNNLFYSRNGAPMLQADATNIDAVFQHNVYYSEDKSYQWHWEDTTYTSLESLRNRTGLEMRNGKPVGMVADPLVAAPGKGGTLGYPLELNKLQQAYTLQKKSPAINKGIPVTSITEPPIHDFFGSPVPAKRKPDIGAHEYRRRNVLSLFKRLFR
ncbi:right-handed parallel beta-helix repeat-containing protein [Pontibacter ruber]|uniref:Right-handed parallel beta-helix repeat-containing protein n=1 Tax=Pontibacter ruber TaxID=1343895 RepID=A0ABW5D1R4_9BACT|nr:right-handed parallel beta-helix repeat-containing protein [Pontibacter ruber]